MPTELLRIIKPSFQMCNLYNLIHKKTFILAVKEIKRNTIISVNNNVFNSIVKNSTCFYNPTNTIF
jgi:hypothetical protein